MSNPSIPSIDEIKAIDILVKNSEASKFFTKLGGYPGIFCIAMYAREIGVPLMAAMFGGMQNIQGKITISPQLMNSMIRKAGHKLEIHSSTDSCTITGTRKDTGESYTSSFSLEDAKNAGIYQNSWLKYPSDMCFARALSRLARRLFPDVIGMCYVEEEIEVKQKDVDISSSITTIEHHANNENSVLEEKPIDREKLTDNFYITFSELDEFKLKKFIESRPNPIESMQNTLKDPEQFKKWFRDNIINK